MVPANVGVLFSGRGSNLVALDEAMRRRELAARIVLAITNVPGAPGVARARERQIPVMEIPHRHGEDRRAHEARVATALEARAVDWLCLAGYMRLLTSDFVTAFRHRIVNIHPSLLPSFPGLAAQQQALEHGVKVSGCTVHLVDEGLDSGPIVLQRPVPVLDDDSEERLAARILAEEHRAYPEALRRLLEESWTIVGRRLTFAADRPANDPLGGGARTIGR